MNEEIKKHLEKHAKKNDWPTDENNLVGMVLEYGYDSIYQEKLGRHRWWTEYMYVVKIDDMFIAYCDAETTGDRSARDCGYQFNPENIYQVYPHEETITVFRSKK